MMRTDANRNPAAFTTDLAKQAGLVLNVDYTMGSPFPPPSALITARLLGDPVEITIRVIDRLGYFTAAGLPRWNYIAIPRYVWNSWSHDQKRDCIGYHYRHEGGVAMRGLFPNYEKTR